MYSYKYFYTAILPDGNRSDILTAELPSPGDILEMSFYFGDSIRYEIEGVDSGAGTLTLIEPRATVIHARPDMRLL